MLLIDLLADEILIEVLGKHNDDEKLETDSPQTRYRTQFSAWKASLSKPSFTIPVLGVQGAGKSTLLNALLMDDLILPVEADETTCIPTEIVYADQDSTEAEIVFSSDAADILVPCTAAGLNPYVNNAENRGNRKNVKFIRIRRKNKLLKNGVKLVDLPGVGSLTKNNTDTTMNYLRASEGAIFVTVPPITQSESIFIQSTWPLMSKVFFIQNRWHGETKIEVEDGTEHSLNVLKQIADRCKLGKTGISIDIVNIHQALTSKMEKDALGIDESGITSIINNIEQFTKDWKNNIVTNIKDNLLATIGKTSSFIMMQIESLNKDSEKLNRQYAQSIDDFNDEYSRKQEQVNQLFSLLNKSETDLKKRIKDEVNIAKGNFRNNMRIITNSGVADGGDLDKAFSDNQKEQTDIVYGEIQPLLYDLIYEIRLTISEISDFEFKQNNFGAGKPGLDHTNKYEEPLKPIGIIGGALLGMEIGSPGGPWGVAAGGLIGGLLGAWASSKVVEKVVKNRAQSAQSVVFPLIEKWKRQLESGFNKQLSDMCDEIRKVVDKWMLDNRTEFEKKIKKLQDNLTLSQDEKEEQAIILQRDKTYLDDCTTQIREMK